MCNVSSHKVAQYGRQTIILLHCILYVLLFLTNLIEIIQKNVLIVMLDTPKYEESFSCTASDV